MTVEHQSGKRQFVKFTFFKVLPEWRRLERVERDRQLGEFQRVVEEWADRTLVRSYSTMGMRGDADFMVWQVSYDLTDLQQMASDLLATALAGYLTTAFYYLSMSMHSLYVVN
jgi:chlorite dismutase